MEIMVEAIGLRKSFGPIRAVDDLSFRVGRGEVLGFLGPNGAGKSTTMRMLTCFLAPDGGTARICGLDVTDQPRGVREAVGYLPEAVPAYGEMTVRRFLEFVGRVRGLRGTALARAVDTVMEKCQLGDVQGQTFETLSKGYKRRTVLAQALLHDPPVLILDEPTDGLDPNQKHGVRKLIAEMAEDKCIILSTHILEEVDAVCTRAVIIDAGKVIADCTPGELRSRSPRHGAVVLQVKGVEPTAAVDALRGLPGVAGVELIDREEGPLLRVLPKDASKIAVPVTEFVHERNWTVEEIHIEMGHLDEVFRDLTRTGGRPS